MSQLLAFFLPAAPLLALLICLVLGRYPGHRAIVRLSERIAARSRRPARPAATPRPKWPQVSPVRGGLLLAHALSGRAPPA
ncbi:MAG TPA: hypothetical protein VHA54_10080 [Solirubrobacterales bacterium]|nr:hypothetical protein [Solirubrobacterales bacterium]